MTTFHKTIGVLNILLIGILFFSLTNIAALAMLAGGTFPLIVLILILFIFIYGTIKALRHLFSKKENQKQLTTIENILMFAPLVNVLLIIGTIFYFMVILN